MQAIQMTGRLEPRGSWGAPTACPIARTFEALGSRSAYVILREALYGATRFEEFVQRTGVSEPVTAARLKDLTEEGILEKVPYQEPGQRTRNEYHLTEKGSDLLPVMVAMARWGSRWQFPDDHSPVQMRHRGCGERIGAVLRCDGGHDVAANEIELYPFDRAD
jgi:DNA-binding HxlR family transcriptional regulator